MEEGGLGQMCVSDGPPAGPCGGQCHEQEWSGEAASRARCRGPELGEPCETPSRRLGYGTRLEAAGTALVAWAPGRGLAH